MNEEYILSCSSTVDIGAEHIARLGVSYISFRVTVDGVEYVDDLGKTLPYDKLYRMMEEGADTKTSQVSIGEYIDYFTKLLSTGKDVLHVCFSSGISGTYNAALSAREIVSESFPERKIYVVDSLAACSGYGLLIDMLAECRDKGYTIEQLRDEALSLRQRVNHLFFSTTLKYYVRGGRISKAAGVIGGMLSICPLMCVSPEGKLEIIAKPKGKKKVYSLTVDEMEARALGGREYSGRCYLSDAYSPEDADAVEKLIRERFPNVKEIVRNSIGTTIGCHTGPGTVALFFIGKEDRYIVK